MRQLLGDVYAPDPERLLASTTKPMIMKPKTNKLHPSEVAEAKFREAYDVSKLTILYNYTTNIFSFVVQAAAEVTKMTAMLKAPPSSNQPFSLSPMYPPFAAFAAFFGQATDGQRWHSANYLAAVNCGTW